MYMAAAPEGQQELDFEAEEVAILSATARLPMHLFVEESGCQDFLKDRLAQEGPFEVVHVSCHGDIHQDLGPVLVLGSPEGGLALATTGEIAHTLGERKAPLVFLSACRTAESFDSRGGKEKPEAAEPFARALIRAGVANVLGYDGLVYDVDATRFARTFYREVAAFASVPYAAAVARRDVLRAHRNDSRQGRHWHLAQVYTGEQGGGSLCDRASHGAGCARRQATGNFSTKQRPECRSRPRGNSWDVGGRRRRCSRRFEIIPEQACCSTAWARSASPAWRRALPIACRSTRPW